MKMYRQFPRLLLAGAAALAVAACSDDNGSSPTPPPPPTGTYADVQAILTADCSGCHGAGSGQAYTVTMDSITLLNSGFVTPSTPSQSQIIVKPTNVVPHGGGLIGTYTQADIDEVTAWIAAQPASAGPQVLATKVAAGTAVPVVDGYGTDVAWRNAPLTQLQIGGGWADATAVNMKVMYDDTYMYMIVWYADDKYSDHRQPWVKQANGSWLSTAAKPTPTPGQTWQEYMGAAFEEEGPNYLYEDKLAIIWNTYGASTIAGFDQGGCSVLCHDPGNGNAPGTRYNYTDQNLAAKKYTNTAGEIGDMWHWKMVRTNQHYKLDDQYVRFWVPGSGNEGSGGRATDPGSSGYGSNPALAGAPTYRGPALTAPPYYIFDNQKQLITPAELAAYMAGANVPNMITSGPTLGRADVDAYGVYSAADQRWTVEMRRLLVNGEATDVQFDDLTRSYAFGVAVFDNAQIEHSWSPTVAKLKFVP
jgi:cytochrome c553